MKLTITLLLSILTVGISHAGVFNNEDLNQAYTYLNQVRIRAGMSEFSQNPQLETAAFNHANYLADNFLTGHYESEDMPGFTGVRLKDRTTFTGYHSLLVSENISYYNYGESSIDSINALMSGIYHRFSFLDFIKNEVGIGIASMSAHSAYVYNMGHSEYNALCQGSSFSGGGPFYFNVCEPNINIKGSDFENVAITGNNPNIVLWPADGDNDVPPAFFEERPDPLPDYSVSGYPISIQFNPLNFTEAVNVTEFKLYRDNREIQKTRLLSESTDPNDRFSALQYALFPLERLEWDTAYRVEAKYSETETLKWHFKTKSLGVPLFTVQGKGEVIEISPNTSAFAVYVPPTSDFPDLGQINYSFYAGMSVDMTFEDSNTLRINNLSGNVGQEVSFSLAGGRNFVVRINSVDSCELATLSSDMKLHIPNLVYTPSPREKPLVFQADLALMGDNLQFKVSNYSLKNKADNCESATLSSDLKLHIPNLVYRPSPAELPIVLWADFELVGEDLQFHVTNYGFK